MVAAVATEDPEVAANRADEPILECIKPPGNHPSHFTMLSYIRSVMPARSKISPIITNIGIATSKKSVEVCHAKSEIARYSGMGLSVYCRIRPNQPSEAAIGTDSPIKPNKIKSVLKSIRLNRFVFDLFV